MSNLLNELHIANIPYINKDQKIIDQHSAEAWKYRIITSICILFAILPFNLQKRLATLRYFSVFILTIVFFTIFVSLYQAPFYYKEYHDKADYQVEWFIKGFKIEWFQGMSTLMLAYNCQITFFYVRGEMRHKSRRRVMKVVKNLLWTERIFYLIIALSGYISLGDNLVPHIYTLRRKISKFNTPPLNEFLINFS